MTTTRTRDPHPFTDPPIEVKVFDPVSVAQAVPLLVGYHPQSSFVVVGVQLQTPLMSIVVDLDVATNISTMNRTVEAILFDGQVDRVYGVVYLAPDDVVDPEDLPYPELHKELLFYTLRGFINAAETLLVHDGLVFSYGCQNEPCCPRLGRRVPPRLYGVVAS